MGLDEKDLESYELESQMDQKEVDGEFVMIQNKNKGSGAPSDSGNVRVSYL